MPIDLHLFLSTFAVIFVAELPDKTAAATLLMATRQKPLGVFVGVCLAFVIQSAIAILFGSLFRLVPHSYVQIIAGILFFVFAFTMWRESRAIVTGTNAATDEQLLGADGRVSTTSLLRVITSAFMVIFVAEWGDLTQLATAALVAEYQKPLTIFFAATFALWSVTGVAVLVGQAMAKKINPQILQRVAAVVFAGVGVFMLGSGLIHR